MISIEEAKLQRETLEMILAAETDDCILWPFDTFQGYPAVPVAGKSGRTKVWGHRYVCEKANGPPPRQRSRMNHAAHDCGVKHCLNPRHLRWATPTDNAQDKVRHKAEAENRKLLVQNPLLI